MGKKRKEKIRKEKKEEKEMPKSDTGSTWDTKTSRPLEKTSPHHTTIKALHIENEGRILTAEKEIQVMHAHSRAVGVAAADLTETLNARRTWNDGFQILKASCQPNCYTQQSSYN